MNEWDESAGKKKHQAQLKCYLELASQAWLDCNASLTAVGVEVGLVEGADDGPTVGLYRQGKVEE